MTHADLIIRAAHWLRKTRRCRVVLTEISSQANEFPDAIGWSGGGATTLVECKVSRDDFRADLKKIFRQCPDRGMGNRRFYMVPPGLIYPGCLPEGWGLIEVSDKQVRVKVRSGVFHPVNTRAEMYVLISELSLYQFVASGGELGPSARGSRIHHEMRRPPPVAPLHPGDT